MLAETDTAVLEPPAATPGFHAWGWPVNQVGTTLALSTTSGFCALELPQSRSGDVLRLLHKMDAQGPVIRAYRPEPWLLLLAEADQVVDPSHLAPFHARLVAGGEEIPLPPAATLAGRSSWVIPPRPDRRWLPGLSTIVWALRNSHR
jgi:hypothetical protein